MKIVIKTKNLKLTPAIRNFIEEKINSLEKFSFFGSPAQILKNKTWEGKGKPRAEAWLEIERTALRHRTGKIFRAECQLHLPKQSIRAETQSEDLKIAINELKDKLQRELKEYKNKLIATRKKEEEI